MSYDSTEMSEAEKVENDRLLQRAIELVKTHGTSAQVRLRSELISLGYETNPKVMLASNEDLRFAIAMVASSFAHSEYTPKAPARCWPAELSPSAVKREQHIEEHRGQFMAAK